MFKKQSFIEWLGQSIMAVSILCVFFKFLSTALSVSLFLLGVLIMLFGYKNRKRKDKSSAKRTF